MNFRILATLAIAASLLGVSIQAARAALAPDDMQNVQNALKGIPAPLDKIGSDLFTRFDEAGKRTYKASVRLFDKDVTVYIYLPDSSPVVAVSGLPDLTARKLAGDWAPELGLKTPMLFWIKKEGMLELPKMPAELKKAATDLGMPDSIQTISGFNLFGKFGSGFIGELLSALNIANTGDFVTGFAMKGKQDYAVSLSLVRMKAWDQPFRLQRTKITGGTVRITGKDKEKTVEAWGTARLDNSKDVTLYVKQEGTFQALGFDTDSATPQDFFTILGITSETLGLPKLSVPSGLPLNVVKLQRSNNPDCKPYADRSSPPVFDCMMFYGNRDGKKIGELITHAKGEVFGQQVAKIDLNASESGVAGSASMSAKIGPLNAGSADFYLNVSKDASAAQKMGIHAKKTVFGDLDLAARLDPKTQTASLELDVPAQCPLRPLGLRARLTSLAVTDFPITPEIKDCFSQEIENIAKGAVEVGAHILDSGKEVALGAAETAKTLGQDAAKAVGALHAERIVAWGPALATHLADLKAAKDAVGAANKAISAADSAIKTLGSAIGKLDDEIANLANEIKNLLKKAWGLITGQVKSKKSEKSKKESERDKKRTEKAAAEKRKKQAEDVLAKANTALSELPGPNLSGRVAELNQEILGAQAQSEVQPQVAQYATVLADSLDNDRNRRKEILSGIDPKEFVDEYKATLSESHKTVSTLLQTANDGKSAYESFLDDARRAFVVRAVSKRIEDETEKRLKETVPTLPTMAFNVPVSIQNMQGLCVMVKPSGYALLVQCSSNRSLFRFSAGGKLTLGSAGTQCMTAQNDASGTPSFQLGKSCDGATAFFYDPMDSLIRYIPDPGNPAPQCLRTGSNQGYSVLSLVPCPSAGQSLDGWQWKLVPDASTKASMAARKPLGSKLPAVPAHRTNLDPLELR